MPIDVTCQNCRNVMRVSSRFAGKRGKCSKCGGMIAVPGNGPTAADPVQLEDSEPLARPQAAQQAPKAVGRGQPKQSDRASAQRAGSTQGGQRACACVDCSRSFQPGERVCPVCSSIRDDVQDRELDSECAKVTSAYRQAAGSRSTAYGIAALVWLLPAAYLAYHLGINASLHWAVAILLAVLAWLVAFGVTGAGVDQAMGMSKRLEHEGSRVLAWVRKRQGSCDPQHLAEYICYADPLFFPDDLKEKAVGVIDSAIWASADYSRKFTSKYAEHVAKLLAGKTSRFSKRTMPITCACGTDLRVPDAFRARVTCEGCRSEVLVAAVLPNSEDSGRVLLDAQGHSTVDLYERLSPELRRARIHAPKFLERFAGKDTYRLGESKDFAEYWSLLYPLGGPLPTRQITREVSWSVIVSGKLSGYVDRYCIENSTQSARLAYAFDLHWIIVDGACWLRDGQMRNIEDRFRQALEEMSGKWQDRGETAGP